MLEKQEKGRNSQFLYGCDTDWNLNEEFIYWVNSSFKEFKNKAKIRLDFHYFTYKGHFYTQGELIDRVIDLTDEIISKEDVFEVEEETVDEVFDIFKRIFYAMWW